MGKPKPVPHTTVMRWAVHPADQGRLAYIDGLYKPGETLPHENAVLTRPFLVDPTTRQPVPVRVVEIRELLHLQPPTLAIVVTRDQ